MKNNISRCFFCRHSDISYDTNTREKIKEAAEDLILNHNVGEFWIGHYGRHTLEYSPEVSNHKRK